MSRNKKVHQEEDQYEFEYKEDSVRELDFTYDSRDFDNEDVTDWMYQDSHDFSERGFNDEDISDLVNSQVVTIEELEAWKLEDNCE